MNRAPAAHHLQVGPDLRVTFHRTLRIPDDGLRYPLPPSLGHFPLYRVADHAERVPAAWRDAGGFFLPMYQREAMWISFGRPHWRPAAVKVGIGGVDAISGRRFTKRLHADPQDYLVCPHQPWLDGINAGEGFIRQFVAMPLGSGYTVEGQVRGEECEGGLEIRVFEPKRGIFPDEPPRTPPLPAGSVAYAAMPCAASPAMGLAAGGTMRQEIYADEHGIGTWQRRPAASVAVHIANSEMVREITGEDPPPTPIGAETYIQHGLPWFDLYREGATDIAPPDELAGVRSISELDVVGVGDPKAWASGA